MNCYFKDHIKTMYYSMTLYRQNLVCSVGTWHSLSCHVIGHIIVAYIIKSVDPLLAGRALNVRLSSLGHTRHIFIFVCPVQCIAALDRI